MGLTIGLNSQPTKVMSKRKMNYFVFENVSYTYGTLTYICTFS